MKKSSLNLNSGNMNRLGYGIMSENWFVDS